MSKNIDPIEFHKKAAGKTTVISKVLLDEETLAVAYTPGVGAVSAAISEDSSLVNELTGKSNTVAIITDGSAVLGLGNIGPEAALPVMEGKAAIFAQFAGINAVPICLKTQDTDEIVNIVKNLEPAFGGINLEDISAPRCFEIEKRLTDELDIPVFHDDQHGTAIVVLAGLINAIKVVGKDKSVKIVISGAGAAGLAIANLLAAYGFTNYYLCDSQGVICPNRPNLGKYKDSSIGSSDANYKDGPCNGDTNKVRPCNSALVGADVLIGVSQPNQFTREDIKTMNTDAIVFALANPIPEIMPNEAKLGGARVIATGRSDFPNQINNALVFPGLFRGLMDNKINKVTTEIKIAVAETLASLIENPTEENIIPSIFNEDVVESIKNELRKFK